MALARNAWLAAWGLALALVLREFGEVVFIFMRCGAYSTSWMVYLPYFM